MQADAGIDTCYRLTDLSFVYKLVLLPEVLNSDGTINPVTNLAGSIGRWNGSNWGACAVVPAIERDTIILAGTGNESITPAWTWHAFRYVQVPLPAADVLVSNSKLGLAFRAA